MRSKLIPMLVVLSLAALAGNGRGQEIVHK